MAAIVVVVGAVPASRAEFEALTFFSTDFGRQSLFTLHEASNATSLRCLGLGLWLFDQAWDVRFRAAGNSRKGSTALNDRTA